MTRSTNALEPIAEIEEMLNGWAKLTWLKDHDGFDTVEGREMATGARKAGR